MASTLAGIGGQRQARDRGDGAVPFLQVAHLDRRMVHLVRVGA
jgi:hypothetical protein